MKVESNPQKLRSYAASAGISDLLLSEIKDQIRLVSYKVGETVMRAGEPAQDFSILVEGKLRVYSLSENGKSITIELVEPYSLFGDIEYLHGCDCLHNVVAETRATLISFQMNDVRAYLESNVLFYRMICKNLVNKLYVSSKNYSRTLLYPVRNRFAYYALEQMQPDGSFYYKNKDLAQHLGITTRHMSRIVTELANEGMLRRDGYDRLILIDLQKLKNLAITLSP